MIRDIEILRKRSSQFAIKLHVSNFVSFYETRKNHLYNPTVLFDKLFSFFPILDNDYNLTSNL